MPQLAHQPTWTEEEYLAFEDGPPCTRGPCDRGGTAQERERWTWRRVPARPAR